LQVLDSGIILYAKKPGITSFSSLWDIKHALHTKKVGHTGTLDSFADGLLVVLSGSMTRLVSHITNFDKTYEAIIRFGVETDTLDPTGQEIKTASLPSKQDLQNALTQFSGGQLQVPPSYSAVHVNGKRASDLTRAGKSVEIKPRQVIIHSISLISTNSDDAVEYAHIRVSVSKGTYIRSLARDIAYACSSCAHLVKLRRTSIGNFSLSNACFNSELEEFSLSMLNNHRDCADLSDNEKKEDRNIEISQSVLSMTEDVSLQCGFNTVILKTQYEDDFFHGRTLFDEYFHGFSLKGENAVFLENRKFCGLVEKTDKRYTYKFVLPSAMDTAKEKDQSKAL